MRGSTEDISKLSKVLSEKCKEYHVDGNKTYQLISLVDDLILVWCKEAACLYSQIFQRPYDGSSGFQESNKIQSLVLSKPPIWDVKHIVINKGATGVLLIGDEGVAVVELPKRWGHLSLFEGGSDVLTCRVKYVGEEFFACNNLLKIVSADWYPSSLDHSFVVLLTSDNYLRLYDLSSLDIPEQAIPVGKPSSLAREGGKFGVEDNVVAFGIGPPSCIQEDSSILAPQKSSETDLFESDRQRKFNQDLMWPVFILHSNGDVYYVLTSLNKKSIKKRSLIGPLSMLPSSFDNYGIDFCSLLVLPSSPAVLVIATTKGYLHHCIVMETPPPQDQDDSVHIEDLSLSVSQLSLEPAPLHLHVYESIHLNISYVDDDSSAVISSPISLVSDPYTPARYWVTHNEGCHGISVPVVEHLIPEDIEFPESDLECHVEHLVCTHPVPSAEPCNVLGICVTHSGTVFCFLSSGLIQAISLPSILLPKVPQFHLQTIESDTSALRKAHRESFEDHIRTILQRDRSQPLLMSGSSPEASPEEYLNLLSKVTNTLRENYIRPQIKAREEIRRRRNILHEQKEHLKRELTALEEEKKNLTDKAHELAEKYEEANDKHSHIMKRLEVVVGNLVRRMPTLSASERGMLKELQDMTEKSKQLQSQLGQIQSNYEWQKSQIEKEKSNEALKKSEGATLSDNQLTYLKISLGKESDKLSALKKKINQIKKEVGM